MSNLTEKLRLLSSRTVATGPVERLLSELDEETGEVLKGLLVGKASIRSIFDELKDAGYHISRDSLSDYRRRKKAEAEAALAAEVETGLPVS